MTTPQVVTNQSQTVVWVADYEPFGKAKLGLLNSISLDLRFPGQYLDNETGLYYNYFRDYDPSIGRYIESDPIGLGGGINTYAYVRNNPVKFVDPFGLFTASVAAGGNITVGKGYGAQSGLYWTGGGKTGAAAAGVFSTQSKTTGFGAGLGVGIDLLKGGMETFNGESVTKTLCVGPLCFSSHSNSDEWIGVGLSYGGDGGGGALPGGSFTHAENCTTSESLIGGQ